MVKKTKQERLQSIQQVGKEIDFELKISGQAQSIINAIDDFDEEHFKAWWMKNYAEVNGGQLHKYLSVSDGFQASQKRVK